TDRTEVLLWSEPCIFGRPQILPCNAEVGITWITADISACSHEIFTIDINPRRAGRVLCPTEDVFAVVDAIEVDWLAVVVGPRTMRWWGQADHLGKCRPAVDVRHHLMILCTCRNVLRPPHQTGYAPAAFKCRAFFAPERSGARVRISILPRSVVSSDDYDGVGGFGADRIHDTADVVVQLHY